MFCEEAMCSITCIRYIISIVFKIYLFKFIRAQKKDTGLRVGHSCSCMMWRNRHLTVCLTCSRNVIGRTEPLVKNWDFCLIHLVFRSNTFYFDKKNVGLFATSGSLHLSRCFTYTSLHALYKFSETLLPTNFDVLFRSVTNHRHDALAVTLFQISGGVLPSSE